MSKAKRKHSEQLADGWSPRVVVDGQGKRYEIGCTCDLKKHNEVAMIQCTDKNCAVWICVPYIIQELGLDNWQMDKLKKSKTIFKCKPHGFFTMINKLKKKPKQQSNELIKITSNIGMNLNELTDENERKHNKTVREQMDDIRYSIANQDYVRLRADDIINLNDILGKYIRVPQKANEIYQIYVTGKTKKGRLFSLNKETEIIIAAGGYISRWSALELINLLYSIYFILKNVHGLKYEILRSCTNTSNAGIIRRIYIIFIHVEELDIIYCDQFRTRSKKAIIDKLNMVSKYAGSDQINLRLKAAVLKLGIQTKVASSTNQQSLENSEQQAIISRNQKLYSKLHSKRGAKIDHLINLVEQKLTSSSSKEQKNDSNEIEILNKPNAESECPNAESFECPMPNAESLLQKSISSFITNLVSENNINPLHKQAVTLGLYDNQIGEDIRCFVYGLLQTGKTLEHITSKVYSWIEHRPRKSNHNHNNNNNNQNDNSDEDSDNDKLET